MTKTGAPKQVSFFQLGRHRLELTQHVDGLIYLNAYTENFPISLSVLAAVYPAGEALLQLLGNHGHASPVPLSELALVKSILEQAADQGIEVQVASTVNCLHLLPWSEAPGFIYRRLAEGQGLERQQGGIYQGDGWFCSEEAYWQLPDVSEFDHLWLEKQVIATAELVEFLRDILPDWQSRNWRIQCDLYYSRAPLQTFKVRSVESDQVQLEISWNGDADDIETASVFPGHVLHQNAVRPGLVPDKLRGQLSDDRAVLTLVGTDIPLFLLQLGETEERLLIGDRRVLFEQHRLYSGQGHLRLVVQREELRGIGTVHAVPTFQVDDLSIPATEVSAELASGRDYLHLKTGWVSRQQVAEAQIGLFGRADNGFALDPISLTPAELLVPGAPRLRGPWEDFSYPALVPPFAGSQQQTVNAQLSFLTQWGLPGGILGTVHRHGEHLTAFLESFARQQAQKAKILIVGTKTVLNYLGRITAPGWLLRWDQQAPEMATTWNRAGIVAVTPNWLDQASGLEQIDWDILCLINVDSLIKSRNSTLFRRLSSLHKLLFIGLFSDLGFRQRQAARVAIGELMGIQGLPLHCWRLLVRDPDQPPEQIAVARPRVVYGARDGQSTADTEPRSYILIQHAKQLVEEASYVAEKLQRKRVLPVPYVEYYAVRPSMSNMNNKQFSWYIYWRHRVRQGEYLASGLDYITLLAAELLNQIGVNSPLEGYQALHRLWTHYRQAFPSLDNSILHWLVDYLLENRLPIDPLEPYREALELGAAVPAIDLLLREHLGRTFQEIPYRLLACLSGYQAERSKFVQDGHRELFEQALGVALDAVDDYFRTATGQGIWAYHRPREYRLLRRRLFQNAPYHGPSRLINFGSALPYSEQSALRTLVTGVSKHTENCLRQLSGYRGKLRAYHLAEPIASSIEERIRGIRARGATRVPITIDLQQVKRLTEQSDQVRDLLLSLSADSPGSSREQPPEPAPPVGSPVQPTAADSRGQGDEWTSLFASLNEVDRAALSVLVDQADKDAWQQFCLKIEEMPEVLLDRLNTLSLDTIGDLLVEYAADGPQIVAEYLPLLRMQLTKELDQGRGVCK